MVESDVWSRFLHRHRCQDLSVLDCCLGGGGCCPCCQLSLGKKLQSQQLPPAASSAVSVGLTGSLSCDGGTLASSPPPSCRVMVAAAAGCGLAWPFTQRQNDMSRHNAAIQPRTWNINKERFTDLSRQFLRPQLAYMQTMYRLICLIMLWLSSSMVIA